MWFMRCTFARASVDTHGRALHSTSGSGLFVQPSFSLATLRHAVVQSIGVIGAIAAYLFVCALAVFIAPDGALAQQSPSKSPKGQSSKVQSLPAGSADTFTAIPPFANDSLLLTIVRSAPDTLQKAILPILDSAEKYRVQILYTTIDRDKKNIPKFTSHGFRVDPREYFYPASSVKIIAALLALEKINVLRQKLRDDELTRDCVINIDSTLPWQRPVVKDITAPDSLPSVAHFIRKVLLVSDNDGYNRLYEFLGQDAFNKEFTAKGFKHFKFTTRLSAGTTNEQNKITPPIALYSKTGRTLYRQPSTTATINFDEVLDRDSVRSLKQGIGSLVGDSLVAEPKNFRGSNYIALPTLQAMLRTVMFPESVPARQRFTLTDDDYTFMYRYMSMLPRESTYPQYDSTYYDSFVKFLMFGDTKDTIPPAIRIFNKVGNAYGYLIDNAYIVDFEKKVEFLLSAVIYVNADGIFNDDKYEYDEIGYPFLAALGKAVYQYEITRKRTAAADLSRFRAVVGADPTLPRKPTPMPASVKTPTPVVGVSNKISLPATPSPATSSPQNQPKQNQPKKSGGN